MTIIEWLESADAPYAEGLALFAASCRSRQKINYLSRKHDPAKLRYELGKLAGCASVTLAPAVMPFVFPEKPQVQLRIIFDGKILFADLPEHMQKVYLEACDCYRQMRTLHEKMKLAETDAPRAALRAELDNVDLKRIECWATIDQWATDGTMPEEEAPTEPTEPAELPTDAKAVNAARASLGRDLKAFDATTDAAKRADLLERMRERVAIIQAANCTFSKNAARLVELGLIKEE